MSATICWAFACAPTKVASRPLSSVSLLPALTVVSVECGAITLSLPAGVAVGEDTKTRTAVTTPRLTPIAPPALLVRAVEALRIGAGAQIDVLCGSNSKSVPA